MPWRKDRFVLRVVSRVGVQFINSVTQGVVRRVRVFVVLGMVQPVLFVPVLVLAGRTAEMGLRVGNMTVRCRILCVSR